MLAKQRYAKILELLEKDGIVHTAELVKLMGVSSETVRKDLEYLDTQGRLSRVHGGAVPISMGNTPDMIGGYISLQMRNSQHLNQKGAITRKAAELVKEGQVIALDYGSTSQIMALALRERFQHITVVTNSIQNALLLADNPGITIILIGGVLNRDEFTLVNEFSSILENIHIDIMFMTVTGIDPVVGCTDQRLSDIRIQSQLHKLASKTIVMADSSKFGRASLLKICSIDEVDTIVTDTGLPPQLESQFRKTSAKLIMV